MKVVAAYLLAMLGGNNSPDEDDIKRILTAAGASLEDEKIRLFLRLVDGKDVNELIRAGRERLAPFSALPVFPLVEPDEDLPELSNLPELVKDRVLKYVLMSWPWKKVLQAKCVSYLNEIISEPSFTDDRSRTSIFMIVLRDYEPDSFLILEPNEDSLSVSSQPWLHDNIRIAGSAGGLILLDIGCPNTHNYPSDSVRNPEPWFNEIYACHPISGLSKKISVPVMYGQKLLADGFSYVKSCGHFFYVRITTYVGRWGNTKLLEVFDITKGEYRIIKNIPKCVPRKFSQRSGTWLEDDMYWLPFGGTEAKSRILGLCLKCYKFYVIDPPPELKSRCTSIGVIKSKLCLLGDSGVTTGFPCYKLWEWEKKENCWTLLSQFTVRLKSRFSTSVCFLNDGRILFEGQILYDYSNNSSKDDGEYFCGGVQAIEFAEDFNTSSEAMDIMRRKETQHYGKLNVMIVFQKDAYGFHAETTIKEFVESRGHDLELDFFSTNSFVLREYSSEKLRKFFSTYDIIVFTEDTTKEMFRPYFRSWTWRLGEACVEVSEFDRKVKLVGPPDWEGDGGPLELQSRMTNAFELLLKSILDENTIHLSLTEGEVDVTTCTWHDEPSLTKGEDDSTSPDDESSEDDRTHSYATNSSGEEYDGFFALGS